MFRVCGSPVTPPVIGGPPVGTPNDGLAPDVTPAVGAVVTEVSFFVTEVALRSSLEQTL